MCGIFYKSSFFNHTDKNEFIKGLRMLHHRGPDEEGILFLEHHAFGHERLAIRDIKNGKQPMSIMNHHLIYNGELYNTEELTKKYHLQLESTSDTEVLLKALINGGIKALSDLNGIYSFVYTNNDDVYLVRDPFGVKPLYYSFIGKDIIVASEMKSILSYKKEAVMGHDELLELLALSPSHSPSKT